MHRIVQLHKLAIGIKYNTLPVKNCEMKTIFEQHHFFIHFGRHTTNLNHTTYRCVRNGFHPHVWIGKLHRE